MAKTLRVRGSPQQLVRGGAAGQNRLHSLPGNEPFDFRVPLVNVAEWTRSSFEPRDFVFVKLDVEGGEVDVLDAMIAAGVLGLIDHLVYECHYGPGPCQQLEKRVRAAAPASMTIVASEGGGTPTALTSTRRRAPGRIWRR